MNRIVATALLIVSLAFVQSGHTQDEKSPNRSRTAAIGNSSRVRLTYLGTAGWEITDGNVVILIDPYLSRLNLIPANPDFPLKPDPSDRRPPVGRNDVVVVDTATIDKHIQRADFILITHSHVDHIMDTPYIARKTGAVVIGHQSSTNVMRASDIPESKFFTVHGGEDYEFGKFSLKVIPSLHSALLQKHYFSAGVISSSIKPPFKLADFAIDGGSLAYLIRIGRHQILTFGSMNYIEREIQGLRPDVVIMGAGSSRAEIYDYVGRMMRALNFPALVLPTHWDNYFRPYEASQDDYIQPLQAFTKEVNAASPRTRVIVPKCFEPIVLEPVKK